MKKDDNQSVNSFTRFCVIFVMTGFPFAILIYFFNGLMGDYVSITSCIYQGIFFGLFMGLIMTWMSKGLKCSKCNTPMPLYAKRTNSKQRFWGGWTCEKCGAELDRKGNVIKKV